MTRLKTAQMKFMRREAGYSLGYHRRNENVIELTYSGTLLAVM